MNIKKLVFSLLAIVSICFANDVNLDKHVIEAKNSNKHILVFLHITGCHHCENMLDFTFEDEKVKKALKEDFIFVDINVKDEGTVSFDGFNLSKMKFANKIGYDMYPSCLFFNKNGELVYDEVGYLDEKKFLKSLKIVTSKSYNNIE